MRHSAVVSFTFCLLFGAVAARAADAVTITPAELRLDGPAVGQAVRSCIIRRLGADMRVISARASDPAVMVDVQEHSAAHAFIVTAIFPPGYVRKGSEQHEIVVRTDVKDSPVVRIPLRVWSGPVANELPRIGKAKSMVGTAWPSTQLDKPDGTKIDIAPVPGKITVVVFSAHYCLHCDEHIPELEQIYKDYAGKPVQFLGVAVSGNQYGAELAVQRWGMEWPYGFDPEFRLAAHFGLKAYPVVFVLGYDGTIEAVHGRYANEQKHNGLENLSFQLRTELDTLLAGHTRSSFPDWDKMFPHATTTQPVAAEPRPDQGALKLDREVPIPAGSAGERVRVCIAVRNPGLKPTRIGKVVAPDGVAVEPDFEREIAPGGASLVYCSLTVPAGPQFARVIRIESKDPRQAVTIQIKPAIP